MSIHTDETGKETVVNPNQSLISHFQVSYAGSLLLNFSKKFKSLWSHISKSDVSYCAAKKSHFKAGGPSLNSPLK